MGRRPSPGLNPWKRDVIPNLPALAGTLTPLGRGGGHIRTIFIVEKPEHFFLNDDRCFDYVPL
jgi:hypothetical protein